MKNLSLCAASATLLLSAPVHAECPSTLPVKLLEDCIVVEGSGSEYPVEEKLAEWLTTHPESVQPQAGDAGAQPAGNAGTKTDRR